MFIRYRELWSSIMLFQMPRDTVGIRDRVRSSEDTELLKGGRRVEEWAGVRAQAWKQGVEFEDPICCYMLEMLLKSGESSVPDRVMLPAQYADMWIM